MASTKREFTGDSPAKDIPNDDLPSKGTEYHRFVATKVLCGSQVINVFVGSHKQSFAVHKDLITLHSGYFTTLFDQGHDYIKVILPQFKPSMFAMFVFWLYHGKSLNFGNVFDSASPELWEIATFLQASAFTNYCMDKLRRKASITGKKLLSIAMVESLYAATKKGSLLRKFIADLMNYKNPFQTLPKGDQLLIDWESLLTILTDLSIDMAKSAGKQWNWSPPWSEEHRESYIEERIPLSQRWETQILAKRPKEKLEAMAEMGCFQSMIELSHLNRYK